MASVGEQAWIAVQVGKTRFEPRMVTVLAADAAAKAEDAQGNVFSRVMLFDTEEQARTESVSLLTARRQAFLDQAMAAVAECDEALADLQKG